MSSRANYNDFNDYIWRLKNDHDNYRIDMILKEELNTNLNKFLDALNNNNLKNVDDELKEINCKWLLLKNDIIDCRNRFPIRDVGYVNAMKRVVTIIYNQVLENKQNLFISLADIEHMVLTHWND